MFSFIKTQNKSTETTRAIISFMRILYGHFIVFILFPMSLLIHVGNVESGYILIEISHIYVKKGCHVDIIVNLLERRADELYFQST